jgi:hypothetical protein
VLAPRGPHRGVDEVVARDSQCENRNKSQRVDIIVL